jgi:hypothetical protein
MFKISEDVLEEANKFVEEKENMKKTKSFTKNYYKERVRAYGLPYKEYMEEKKEYYKAYRDEYRKSTKGYCHSCKKEYSNLDQHYERSIHKKRLFAS